MEALRLYRQPTDAGDEPSRLPEWRERAACRDEPADLFFDESTVAEATAVCDSCAVAAECLADALELPWLLGVFGGLTAAERRHVRDGREPPARKPPRVPATPAPESRRKPCGTTAAYARHRRRGEDACDACKEAQRLKSAEAHRRRRERAQEAHGDADVPEAA